MPGPGDVETQVLYIRDSLRAKLKREPNEQEMAAALQKSGFKAVADTTTPVSQMSAVEPLPPGVAPTPSRFSFPKEAAAATRPAENEGIVPVTNPFYNPDSLPGGPGTGS